MAPGEDGQLTRQQRRVVGEFLWISWIYAGAVRHVDAGLASETQRFNISRKSCTEEIFFVPYFNDL